jgi:hypothetical protein
LLVALCLCGAGAAAADPDPERAVSAPRLPAESLARLRAGEILLEDARTDESGGAVRVRALFHGPVERIWEVLGSCKRSFEYVDGLRSCEVIEPGLEHSLVTNSVKKSWVIPRLDYTVEFERAPYTRIDFHKTEGDLDLLEGYWHFGPSPDGDGLLVTHGIRVKPRFPVPRWLVRRSMYRDIPDMVACLRSLAGASGSDERWRADNGRCPSPGNSRIQSP